MSYWSRGAFDFTAETPVNNIRMVRSVDGLNIEVANMFVDGGDHVNIIPWEHAYLHKGAVWSTELADAALANGANLDLILSIGAAKDAHTIVQFDCSGDALCYIYEAATYTGGVANTVLNKVRGLNPMPTPNVSAFNTPSITGTGTLLETRYIAGGSGGKATGASAISRNEWVLKPSTIYLLRLNNASGQNRYAHIYAEWYDHGSITSINQV